jgi:hypothetical protein
MGSQSSATPSDYKVGPGERRLKTTQGVDNDEERTRELVDFACSDSCEISTSSAKAALPARHDDIVLVIYALVGLRSLAIIA